MSIERDLLEYIKRDLAPQNPEIGTETNLIGVIDSVAVMEVVVWIEGRYGFDVEIDDITPDNFGTVQALAAYIGTKRKK